jgi:hypothetical protein
VSVQDRPVWCESKIAKSQFSLGCEPLLLLYIFPTGKDRYMRYTFGNFLFDIFMICLTCGFWLVWIFIREMRGRR